MEVSLLDVSRYLALCASLAVPFFAGYYVASSGLLRKIVEGWRQAASDLKYGVRCFADFLRKAGWWSRDLHTVRVTVTWKICRGRIISEDVSVELLREESYCENCGRRLEYHPQLNLLFCPDCEATYPLHTA